MRAALAAAPPPHASYGLRDWLAELDDDAGDTAPVRSDALARVLDAARRLVVAEPAAAIADLRAALEGTDHGPGAVDVATFHAAKGLEWPVVIVAGCEEGLVPHVSAGSAAARAEERRLLYVAMTRAERRLHLTWAEERVFAGVAQPRRPSPWLERLPVAADGDGPAEPPPPGARPRPAGAPPEPPVLAALRSWRTAAARAAGVPPAVVCPDAVLAAVAERAPRSPAELALVPGLSTPAARRFGPRLLEVVAAASDGRAS